MDSDKSFGGDLGCGVGHHRGGHPPDSPSEHRDPRFSNFEQDCIDDLELDAEDEASSTGTRSDGGTTNSLTHPFIDTSAEQASHRLWLAFQHTASSISQLYRDHCAAPGVGSPWYSFQTAAEACTEMYKESTETLKMAVEGARREGRKQLKKELVMWMKKRGRRGRHLRREELLAFLSGKNPPPPPSRPMTTVASGLTSSSGVAITPSGHHRHQYGKGAILSSHCHLESAHRRLGASPPISTNENFSHRFPSEFSCHEIPPVNPHLAVSPTAVFLEPDLRTFRDALAVQGLSGALSNIRVAGSPHSPHGGGTTPPIVGTASGGASPLRHQSSVDRIRTTPSSGRQTPSSRFNQQPEDLHQFISDHMTLHESQILSSAATGNPLAFGENADPLNTPAPLSHHHHHPRKRSASQSGNHQQLQQHEIYVPSAESPTRKRHRLI